MAIDIIARILGGKANEDLKVIKEGMVNLYYDNKQSGPKATSAIIEAYVKERGFTDETRWVTIKVIEGFDNHIWLYESVEKEWKDIGSDSIQVDTEMSYTSTNAVQNKVITQYVDEETERAKNAEEELDTAIYDEKIARQDEIARLDGEKQEALNDMQINAVNSGIDSTKVSDYDAHIGDIDIHVTTDNKNTWNAKLDATKSTLQTTEPTAAITDGGIHLVFLDEEPENEYNGYVYLINEEETGIPDYLEFKAIDNGVSIAYALKNDAPIDTSGIQKTTNGGITWENWDGTAVILNKGRKLGVRNTNSSLSLNVGQYFYFETDTNHKFEVSGNIMSMLNYRGSLNQAYCLNSLFINNHALVNAENLLLPATSLSTGCYAYMFNGCTSLVTPPKELPAETHFDGVNDIDYAYMGMFLNCFSLIKSPIINTTNPRMGTHQLMFRGCNSLKTIYMPKYLKQPYYSWSGMFFTDWIIGVPNTSDCIFYFNGDVTKVPRNSTNGIPDQWTIKSYS